MRAPAALIGAALVTLGVVLVDRRSIVGPVLVLAFLSLAPGTALARLGRFPERGAAALAVAVAASFALDALVTETMVYARVWTPARGLFVVAGLTIVLVAAERLTVGAARSRPPAHHRERGERGTS